MLRGWVTAADLRTGDAVRQVDGEYGVVNQVALVAYTDEEHTKQGVRDSQAVTASRKRV